MDTVFQTQIIHPLLCLKSLVEKFKVVCDDQLVEEEDVSPHYEFGLSLDYENDKAEKTPQRDSARQEIIFEEIRVLDEG